MKMSSGPCLSLLCFFAAKTGILNVLQNWSANGCPRQGGVVGRSLVLGWGLVGDHHVIVDIHADHLETVVSTYYLLSL